MPLLQKSGSSPKSVQHPYKSGRAHGRQRGQTVPVRQRSGGLKHPCIAHALGPISSAAVQPTQLASTVSAPIRLQPVRRRARTSGPCTLLHQSGFLLSDTAGPARRRRSTLGQSPKIESNNNMFVSAILSLCSLGVALLSDNIAKRPYLNIKACNITSKWLFDTGAAVSCMSLKQFRNIPVDQRPIKMPPLTKLVSAASTSLNVIGVYNMPLPYRDIPSRTQFMFVTIYIRTPFWDLMQSKILVSFSIQVKTCSHSTSNKIRGTN
jgi:hypothetical protein